MVDLLLSEVANVPVSAKEHKGQGGRQGTVVEPDCLAGAGPT